jgi:hypothetical protein
MDELSRLVALCARGGKAEKKLAKLKKKSQSVSPFHLCQRAVRDEAQSTCPQRVPRGWQRCRRRVPPARARKGRMYLILAYCFVAFTAAMTLALLWLGWEYRRAEVRRDENHRGPFKSR